MLSTTVINTPNAIRTQTGAAERYSSCLDSNLCYYRITIAFNYRSLYDTKTDAIMRYINLLLTLYCVDL